jgi:hypothetical protein
MKPLGTRTTFGLTGGACALVALTAALAAAPALAGPPPCQAKNVRTAVEYKGASALATAITDAASGDTINVYGTCYGNFRINKDLSLQGQGKNATLDGNQTGRVLRVGAGTTTVRALKITNGKTTGLGGGIYVGSAAVLENVLVTGNEGGLNNFGGGIEADLNSSLTLVGSKVTGNTAGSSGGIDIFTGAKVSITNSTVSGNHATGATAEGCAFGDPLVHYNCAGGIWNYHGTLALTNSTVAGNDAGYRGGGLRNDAEFQGGSQIDGFTLLGGSTTISSNSAGNQGGGIWATARTPNPSPPPDFLPVNPNGTIKAADGTASYKDPVTGATLPAWTGSVSGNTPDQCFPTLALGSSTCAG